MKCPHCLTDFHDNPELIPVGDDNEGVWGISKRKCSACGLLVLHLIKADKMYSRGDVWEALNEEQSQLIRPKVAARTPPSPDVPPDIAKDYLEACLVVGDSPQASAALSRRCLQHLLRKFAGVKPCDLSKEIDEVLSKKMLPSHLAESIDAIRTTGNFAAHPIKSTTTGEIVEVEPGEADWNLDLLESLFDFFFVQPALTKAKRDALNKKLADAGKPLLKK
jgi:hypothetical protein